MSRAVPFRLSLEQTQRLAQIQADIATQRRAHAEAHETLLQLLRNEREVKRKIDLILMVKQDTRRELARLRKAKSRLITRKN